MMPVDAPQPVATSAITIDDARQRFAQWREGKAGTVLAVSVIGDSYTAGQDFYLNKLVQRVAAEVGFAGPGYVGFNHGAALGGTHFKYTRSSDKYFGGGWKVSELGGPARTVARSAASRAHGCKSMPALRRASIPRSLRRNCCIWAMANPMSCAIAGRPRKPGNR